MAVEGGVVEGCVSADTSRLVDIRPKHIDQLRDASLAAVLGCDHQERLAHTAGEKCCVSTSNKFTKHA
jgi:hypothetical protein